MKTTLVLALFTILVALSCASAPKAHSFNRTNTFPVDLDATWSAVIDAFGELNIPIDNLEKDSGLITTDWMRVEKDYMDCGGSGISVDSNHRGRFNVVVRQEGAGTKMTVNSVFTATRSFGDSSAERSCVSTGFLENTLHRLVAERIRF
jgi:hypothetical protein